MSKDKTPHNTGKEFEEIVAAIHEQFSNGATITKDERVRGKSGMNRQIDVAIRTNIAGYKIFIIVECKDYKEKVGIDKVDELIGKMEDVEANKAILVSNSGFTKDALERAKKDERIDLSSVVNIKNKKLRVKLAIPFLAHIDSPSSLQLRVTSTGPSFGVDLIQREQIKFHKLWNQQSLNTEPGDHNYDDIVYNGADGKIVVTMIYSVKRNSYFKEVLLEDSTGIYNHKTNGYTTREFILEPISTDSILKWKKVEGKLPKATMQILGKSSFPDIQ